MKTNKCKTMDEYISSFPGNIQKRLEAIRKIVRKTAPNAVETVSYQMPTYKLNGKNLVHFAAFSNHIGFYPIPSGIRAFKEEFASYKHGKGSVQFPLDKPLPLSLIKKVVEFRVTESKAEAK